MNNLTEIEGKSKDPMWQRLFKSNTIMKEIYANKMHNLRMTNMYNTNAAFKARVNAARTAAANLRILRRVRTMSGLVNRETGVTRRRT
jgi:hypothetical protein